MPKVSYGDVNKNRAKQLLDGLLAYVNCELDEFEGIEITYRWQEEQPPKLVVETQRRTLEFLTAKDSRYSAQLTDDQIRKTLTTYLRDFLEILEDTRGKTQGKDEWHFTLKLWSKEDRDRNLAEFDQLWEAKRPGKSKPSSLGGIDWRQLCQEQATERQAVSTSSLTYGDRIQHDRADLYVPLGLVERKGREQRQDVAGAEQGSELYGVGSYEVTETYEQERFFQDVLAAGKTKSNGRRLAIIGEPGAGKTTLLQTIEQWVLTETDAIAVWVSLADLRGQSLEDYLLGDGLKRLLKVHNVNDVQREQWVKLFKAGRVWLLLDGVDEIAGTSSAVLGEIAQQLTGWLEPARVILTCRLNVWDGERNALFRFDTFRMLEFSYPAQVEQFIERWFDSEPLAAGLKEKLAAPEQSRIQDLVKNPLRLALLCWTWQRRQDKEKKLPNTQAGLYERFVEVFYEWKGDRFPTTAAQRRKLNKALGKLALRAMESEGSRFRLTGRFVRKVLGDADAGLYRLALDLGWLNRVGVAAENPEEEVFAFYHATFQEYFTACAIQESEFFFDHIPPHQWKGFKSYSYRIFEHQWIGVFLIWMGRNIANSEKNKILDKLRTFNDECAGFYSARALWIISLALAEYPEYSKADFIIDSLIQFFTGSRLELGEDHSRLEFAWGFTHTYTDVEVTFYKFWFTPRELILNGLLRTDRKRLIGILNTRLEFLLVRLTIFSDDHGEFEIRPNSLCVLLFKMDILVFTKIIEESIFLFAELPIKKKQIKYFSYLSEKTDYIELHLLLLINIFKSLNLESDNVDLAKDMLIGSKFDHIKMESAFLFKKKDTLYEIAVNSKSNMIRFRAMEKLRLLNPESPEPQQLLSNFVLENSLESDIKMAALVYLSTINPQQQPTRVLKEDIKKKLLYDWDSIFICNTPVIKAIFLQINRSGLNRKELIKLFEILNSFLNKEIQDEHYRKLSSLNGLLWHYSLTMSYEDFYHRMRKQIPIQPINSIESNPATHPILAPPENQQKELSLDSLQHLPIYCLNAQPLAKETREPEIALKLCKLIWKELKLKEIYPDVATPSQLCRYLDQLQLNQQLSHRAILLTHCEHPTPELITFCSQITDSVAIAWLTEQTLEAPLKGFPPNHPNLTSAIEAWLAES